jgi:predicted urease superfamily metal-dependent hydrolase
MVVRIAYGYSLADRNEKTFDTINDAHDFVTTLLHDGERYASGWVSHPSQVSDPEQWAECGDWQRNVFLLKTERGLNLTMHVQENDPVTVVLHAESRTIH